MIDRNFFPMMLIVALCVSWMSQSGIAESTRSESIGFYTAGCIKNAAELPQDGTGYQVIRLSRKRFYAHPDLVEYIRSLGETVVRDLSGTLLIGDLSQENGGRMPGDHSSHQIGLDVDILLWQHPDATKRALTQSEREEIHPLSVLTSDDSEIDDSKWRFIHGEILKLAASSPRVERIFVNPLIKKKLCGTYPGEEWLRKIRPWYGHDGHFHVRLGCPANNLLCESQEPVPPGDGCGADLAWWFTEEAKKEKLEPSVPRALPKECLTILAE